MKSNQSVRYVILSFSLVLSIVLSSCSTSSDVVSSNIIQKRKHRNGYHLNLGTSKSPNALSQRIPASVSQPSVIERASSETQKGKETQASRSQNQKGTHSKLAATKRALSDITKASFQKGPKLHAISWFKPRSNHDLNEGAGARIGSVESILPEEDEELNDKTTRDGNIALITGVLTWVFSIFGVVTNFIVPGLGVIFSMLALVLAIMAVVFGKRSKNESDMGMVGFILGLIYLILAAIGLLLLILVVVFIFLILASA